MNTALDIAKQRAILIRRHLLVLLVAAYFCSTFFPRPGLWLRAPFSTASQVSLIHLMLATLLFTLGLSISWSRIGEVIGECKWVGVTLAVRLATCVALILLAHLVPIGLSATIVGFVLVMAAPTAASSSGWSMQLGCSESVTVAVIMGTTIVSVISAPLILALGVYLGPDSTAQSLGLLRDVFDASFVLPWVVMPTLLGISIRSVFPNEAVSLRNIGHALSPIILLLLNYSNGSSSLPQLRESHSISAASVTIAGCIGLFTIVSLCTSLLSGWMGADRSQRLSAILGAGMCNTGLALVVATMAMPKEVEIHLAIIVYTFVQHFSVALLTRFPRIGAKGRRQASVSRLWEP